MPEQDLIADLDRIAVFARVHPAPMNKLFHTVPIPLDHVFIIGVVASSVLWVEEIRKWFARRSV